MKLSADRISQALSGPLAPSWLIVGDEPLVVAEAADAVREAARAQGFTERELHTVERGFDWPGLTASASTGSLFADRRLLELRLGSARPGDVGAGVLAALVSDPDPDRLLLVIAPKLDGAAARSKWVKAFEAGGVLVQAWPVEAQALPGWIRRRMRAAGLTPDDEAVQLLASRCEGNLLAARQEIDKLALTHGGGTVGAEQVLDSAGDSARFDVFRLADTALAGEAARALRMLDGLRAEGVEPVLISWALTRELRALLRLRRGLRGPAEIDRALEANRVWPRRRALVKNALLRLNVHRLVDLHALAAHTDRCIKGAATGRPWELLTELVLGLSRADAPLPQAARLKHAARELPA